MRISPSTLRRVRSLAAVLFAMVAGACPPPERKLEILSVSPLESGTRGTSYIAQLEGRVWRKHIDKDQLAEHQARFEVLSTRLVGGRPRIHVYAEADPGEGFTPVEPGLEDVYFQRLGQHARAA